ncbi:MAG: DUF5615 family PIN-like protein [Bacteroidota bacterium]
MIIADENVDKILVDRLIEENYEVLSIMDYQSGISDAEVINIAKSKEGLLLTEDKDFGELVFSYDIRGLSIIFIRYDKSDYEQIEKNILNVLKEFHDRSEHFYITVTKRKIRIRKI